MPATACVVLAAIYRPSVLARGPAARLDTWLILALGAALLQTLPLPRWLAGVAAPASARLARTLSLVDPGGLLPIAIDPGGAAVAALIFAGVVLLFVTARQIFAGGGVRVTSRGLALAGIALSAIAIAQDATAGGLMYWRWRPIDEGPPPFGPFLNRNHFATWAVMVVPLCVGYLAAHASAHPGAPPHASWRRKVVAALDARAALLLAAAALLILATAVSLSRSGIVGLAAALVCGGELARRRAAESFTRAARPAMLAVALGSVAMFTFFAVLVRVGPSALVGRFAAADIAMVDRVTIWRETLPVIRDFWLTGTGVGTYQTAMAVYQRSSPGVLFNQAHNHYLQALAEGGLLVSVPAALALASFVSLAWRRIHADTSGMFWLRAGAASGLAGAAVQSVWETGLTTPANAALAAVLAAIVVHAPGRPAAGGGR